MSHELELGRYEFFPYEFDESKTHSLEDLKKLLGKLKAKKKKAAISKRVISKMPKSKCDVSRCSGPKTMTHAI